MQRVVYKYPLYGDRWQVPHGQIIHVGWEAPNLLPTVWIDHGLVQQGSQLLRILGTGHVYEDTIDRLEHIGSAQCGEFVWHVYKVLN